MGVYTPSRRFLNFFLTSALSRDLASGIRKSGFGYQVLPSSSATNHDALENGLLRVLCLGSFNVSIGVGLLSITIPADRRSTTRVEEQACDG